MKKTLAAVAILGAFAASASADVTVYGRLDTGIAFDQVKASATVKANGLKATISGKEETTSMDNGNLTGSRIGFKGSEKIGDTTFGFVLEGGVAGDTGVFSDFKRAAAVYAQGAFGTIQAGRMGTVWSDAYAGKYVAIASVDGSGHGGLNNKAGGLLQFADSRYDNMITYTAPKLGGVEVFAQYGMGNEGTGENESTADRYMAAGATYAAGALKVAAMVETMNEKSVDGDVEDMFAFHVGGQYDFGVAKVSAMAAYFKDANDIFGATKVETFSQLGVKMDDAEGYGVSFGVAAPVCGGTLTATAGYLKGDATVLLGDDLEANVYNVGVNYQYKLSKAVNLYAGAGYTEAEFDLGLVNGAAPVDAKVKTLSVGAGMVYYF